jgi:hypothetical protein
MYKIEDAMALADAQTNGIKAVRAVIDGLVAEVDTLRKQLGNLPGVSAEAQTLIDAKVDALMVVMQANSEALAAAAVRNTGGDMDSPEPAMEVPAAEDLPFVEPVPVEAPVEVAPVEPTPEPVVVEEVPVEVVVEGPGVDEAASGGPAADEGASGGPVG